MGFVLEAAATGPTAPAVRAARRVPIVLPSPRDPRLHVAAVVVTLQVLGQTVLHFELSVAQILLSVCTCAAIELAVTWRRTGIVAWPASALLTGNGVAFILRVPGTRHGDWWSVRGGAVFVAVAAASLLTKYLVRVGGRQVFNPSNIGLVLVFLLLGSRRANPQDLWWGRFSPSLALTLTVIVVGGVIVVCRLRLLGMAVAYWLTWVGATGALTGAGHCMTARWHVGAVCGRPLWWVLVTSPEILVFLFFMITDPRTAPATPAGRMLFGAATAAVGAALAARAGSEFGIKVAVLGGLALVCAGVAVAHALQTRARSTARQRRPPRLAVTTAAWSAVLLAGVLAALGRDVGAPARAAVTSGPDTAHAITTQGPLPPVGIDDDVHSVDGSVTDAVARTMARDLLDDLATEADALRTGDATRLVASSIGPRLDDLRARIATGAPARVSAPGVAYDALTVVVLRDPGKPQAAPRLGIRALMAAGSSEVFELASNGGRWLIAGTGP
jgi:Na+-translocating ferredoxin:NAD+ oxidoreductase RnfD subunit